MDFTFGIVTAGDEAERIHRVIDTIERERIPTYEIVVVGGDVSIERRATRHIAFDETQKPVWITRKKNLVTENARYENLVFLHDYVALEAGWYAGFLEYGDDFQAVMTRVSNADGTRYTDWTLSNQSCEGVRAYVVSGEVAALLTDLKLDPCERRESECLLPYEVESDYLNQFMYFSGTYWVAKRSLMQEIPLDEALSWGQSEDLLWSQWVRERHRFSLNARSGVRFLKQKERLFGSVPDDVLGRLRDLEPMPSGRLVGQHVEMANACVAQRDTRRARWHLERAMSFGMTAEQRVHTERLMDCLS